MFTTVSRLLIQDIKVRLLEESLPRLLRCIEMLTDDQVKYNFNEHTNSIANLICHLESNCKQWMFNPFLNDTFERDRKIEFTEKVELSIEQLKEKLGVLQKKIEECLDQLTEAQLTANFTIQGFHTNGVSILVHVTEHFSYHTGQIALITKILINKATLFYDDSTLNAFKK